MAKSVRTTLRPTLLAVVVLGFPSDCALGDQARDIRSGLTNPVAIAGDVLMLPLVAGTPGDRWPNELRIEFPDGQTVTGVVGWLHRGSARPEQTAWTASASMDIRPIAAADDSGTGTGQPVLLARLPDDASGLIRVAGRNVAPEWFVAPPEAPDALLAAASIRPEMRLDRPVVTDPFEHWRWVLLEQEDGRHAPSLDRFTPIRALLADHYAGLWRAALARLERLDPALAHACRRELTLQVRDGSRTLAAWTTSPQSLGALLGALLDRSRGDVAIRSAVENWLAVRPPLLVWLEATDDRAVQLAAINRTTTSVFPVLEWSDGEEIPIAVELEPGVVTRITADRPHLDDETTPTLALALDDLTMTVALGPARLEPRPPGLALSRARPCLTLNEVESGAQRPVAADRATSLEVRRRDGRWEAFVECMRPAPSVSAGADDRMARVASWRDLAGIEAITLVFGDPSRPRGVLAIPETGWHRLLTGANDGTLQVHRGRYADRWFARITVPDAWIERDEDDVPQLRLGAARTHADTTAIETLPYTSAPWRQAPGCVVARLDRWPF